MVGTVPLSTLPNLSSRISKDSEASTDVCSEGSAKDSEANFRSLLWCDDDGFNVDAPVYVPAALPKPVGRQVCTPLRFNTGADAFKPQAGDEIVQQQCKDEIAKVVNYVVVALQECAGVTSVDVSEDLQDCSVNIKILENDTSSVDDILYFAKEALSNAVSKTGPSRGIYVLGYCTQNAFAMTPQSFEVTLGAMDNASTSCWTLFKKGFCRHDKECIKSHPAVTVTLRILVETAARSTSVPEVLDYTKHVSSPAPGLNASADAFEPQDQEQALDFTMQISPPRLNTSADAFQPQEQEEPVQQEYKKHFAKIVRYVVEALQECSGILSVEATSDLQDRSVIIKLLDGDTASIDNVLYFAKLALWTVVNHGQSQSKGIYVIGYCSPNPFTETPQGFEVTLGAMECASTACWTLFKKGFCRHDKECQKGHPAAKVTLRILVEAATLSTFVPEALDFALQISDLMTTVVATLESSPHVKSVEAWTDTNTQCWSIQLSPKHISKMHKDYVLTLAKNAFFEVTSNSQSIYMLGYEAKPFMAKTDGVGLMLANMRSEATSCWSFYSCGQCKKEGGCQWEHPSCLMPVSIIIKSHRVVNARLN